MNPTLPSDLLQYLKTRALPKRLVRVGLALTSTFYSLRPDSLLAKSAARSDTPERDWPIEGGLTPLTLPERPTPSRGELFFIDAGVADPGAFWLAAPKGGTVVCIPAGVDSWRFMAQEAARFQGLSAIHIVSHGQPGAVVLNGQHYAAADLETLTVPLQQLGHALTKNGDIFLYGCEVGAGVAGQTCLTLWPPPRARTSPLPKTTPATQPTAVIGTSKSPRGRSTRRLPSTHTLWPATMPCLRPSRL